MFIDFVICKYPVDPKKYLFIAPPFSHLEEGDEVVVEDGEPQCATVIDSKTVSVNSDEYYFILNLLGVSVPLKKVISKVIYRRFEYTEEENELDFNTTKE